MDPSELPRGSNDPVTPHGIPHSGESAEDGSFLVHGWSQSRGAGLMIRAAGFLDTVIPASEIQDPLHVTLQRGLSLTIKVESDNRPIAGARVKLVHRLTSNRTRSYSDPTQNSGRVTFHGKAPGLYYATVSDERGYGQTQPFELTASGHVEVLELGHGAGFELTAIDELGNPLPNLFMHMDRIGGLPGTDESGMVGVTDLSSASGKTNVNGRYQMRVRPGVWLITATPKDRTPLSQKVELHANDIARLEHQFGLMGSLEVTAIGPDGKPLQDLKIALAPEDGEHSINRVDVAGKCHFTKLEPGAYMLYPWNPRQQPGNTPAGAVSVTVRPGEQTKIELNNAFVSMPTFRVLRDGNPVVGAEIRLTPLYAETAPTFDSRHRPEQRTDASGTWHASPLRVGRYLVIARGGDNQPEQRWEMELKSGQVHHDLNLHEFHVQGRLILPTGESIRGVRVELERQILAADGTVMEAPIGPGESGMVGAVSTVDGEFSFQHVPAGTWQLRIRGQHWTGPNKTLFEVTNDDLNLGALQVEESCAVKLKLSARAIKEAERGPGSTPQLELLHVATGMRFQLFPNDQGLVERSDLPAGEYQLLFADRPASPLTLSTDGPAEALLD